MTRINTIDPSMLTDQHLMAEYRELPMVNASLARSLKSKRGVDVSRIPSEYTLNTGHVLHFYDKGRWLHDRYNALISELRSRGYEIDPESRVVDWTVFQDNGLYGSWKPDSRAHAINVERIILRIEAKLDWYRMNKSPITVDYVNKLKRQFL